MTPDVSVIVVTYRSAGEARECVASLRGAFAADGTTGEIVLVDCGSGDAETRRLAAAGADVLVALPDNRGYSGGVNAGLARARSFRLLATNADVLFRPGAIRPLLEAVDDPRTGAAAPLAFWDAADRVRLPPGWAPGFRSDLAQLSAPRSSRGEEERFAAYARKTVALWEKGGDAPHLAGAVLAAHRETFDRAGRFDERFPFEYEETEWEDRVRAEGLTLRFVPASRVRHRWGSSAAPRGETADRRTRSRDLYWRRRYGRIGRAVLSRARKRNPSVAYPSIAEPRIAAREGAWVAVSTNSSLLPFAGAPLDSDFLLSDDVVARLPQVPLYLRSFRASDGHPLETFVWERETL
jgi:N-acetylglucosaminyl-diphospho-decaprenol L-rhamnosyltransferase